jgi:hypothetical protein
LSRIVSKWVEGWEDFTHIYITQVSYAECSEFWFNIFRYVFFSKVHLAAAFGIFVIYIYSVNS